MTALKELVERLLNARDEGQNYIVLSTSSASREENAETLARAAIDHLSSDLSELERMREALEEAATVLDECVGRFRDYGNQAWRIHCEVARDKTRQALSPAAKD